MPTRILRDWTDSKRVAGVSAEAERLFVRLLMRADDFGRFHADPQLVTSACFPFGGVLAEDVLGWLEELVQMELVIVYEVKGRMFLAIYEFKQRARAKVSKFPSFDGQPSDWCPTHDGQNAQVIVKPKVKPKTHTPE